MSEVDYYEYRLVKFKQNKNRHRDNSKAIYMIVIVIECVYTRVSINMSMPGKYSNIAYKYAVLGEPSSPLDLLFWQY